jgi:hypothetical protein
MVYCSRCGTQNTDDAKHCSHCGAPLYSVGQNYPGSDREHYRRMEGECFGLPNGGMIVAIVFGFIIVLVGLGLFLEASGVIISFWGYLWPVIILIFGFLIILGALFGRRRHRAPA